MVAIKIFALIFSLLLLIKLVVVTFKPKVWMKVSKKLTKNVPLMMAVFLILAAVSGFLLFKNVTIVQAGAVMFFTFCLAGLSWAPYTKKLMEANEEIGKNLLSKSWLSIVIWLLLAIWMLIRVFT